MKNLLLLTLSLAIAVFAVSVASAQSVTNHKSREEAEKNAGQGITFKIPDGVMQLEWKDFKGLLMLYPKTPGGLFVTYPDKDESIDALKTRALTSLARMFIHDDKKAAALNWTAATFPSHPGDKGPNADVKVFEGDADSIQIVIYERERNGLTLIYGHFARKSKTSKDKDDSAAFLDEQGNGSKPFDKFWKSFPK